MSRVLVIGDIHEPVAHPGYLDFCRDTARLHACDSVVFIGDVVDWHGVSFHARHPKAPGTIDEYELAKEGIAKWHRAFPNATVCIGNHDERLLRLAESVGIPASFLRDYAEVWETPGWDWTFETTIDGVYYFHGTGRSGMHPAFNVMKDMGMSVCMGHVHSSGGIKWAVSPTARRFGMDVGCGVDDRMFAFAYNKHTKRKSVLSCGTVIDGIGQHHIMPCGRGEAYDRERYPANPLLERS
jgi:predicted phosphodiesterase